MTVNAATSKTEINYMSPVLVLWSQYIHA